MLVRGVPLEALASLEGEPDQWLEEPSLFLVFMLISNYRWHN